LSETEKRKGAPRLPPHQHKKPLTVNLEAHLIEWAESKATAAGVNRAKILHDALQATYEREQKQKGRQSNGTNS
jgi:hypothetical protein